MNRYDEYYPRPLLKRASFYSLNGEWSLNNHPIEVPFPVESSIAAYQGETDRLEYEKSFVLPDNFYKENDKVILHFGAVDQICDVYLNDIFLLHHEGGYLPFSINITEYLQENNVLHPSVKDELDYFYPYGKQSKKPAGMWYTPVSGIWQSVWLEAYDTNGIDNVVIDTDMNTLNIQIDSNAEEFRIEFENYANTFKQKDISINISNPHLWSIDNPYLYKLKISTTNDEIESYFAFKEIQIKNINGYNRLYLNNEPVFINGLLDQGYFEEGIYTPEDPRQYEQDVLNMKELGFNCLRKHIKIEPEAFYYYCDLHGILVIQDMVNSGEYHFFKDTILPTIGLIKMKSKIKDQKRYDFFLKHSKDTINHLKSHPSIIGYTIYNEGWGQQNASEVYEILKPLDPKRLFDSTSGWFFDDKSDFDSYHVYFRNKVLKGKNKLLLLSECGGFIRDIKEHKSEKGSTWGYGKTDSEEALTDKIEEMHNKMYIPSIKNGLVGAIYTQVSDVEGEINGIYTYDRKVCKVDKKRLLSLNNNLQEIYKNECK